jgi:hypothetical protein
VCGGLRLTRLAQEHFPLYGVGRVIGFFPKSFRLLGEAIRKRQDVLEAAALHGALLSIQGRRERVMAISSQI